VNPGVVCLGMNEESAAAIDALVAAGASIRAIAGLPAAVNPSASDYVDLANVAQRHGLTYIPVGDVNDASSKVALRTVRADVLFVLGWSQLLDEEVIGVFPGGVIGSHPSMLPMGRGRAPIPWTILEEHSRSAVSLFRMTPGVDDGPIVKRAEFDLPTRPTARDVYDLAKDALSRGFVGLYHDLCQDSVVEQVQDTAKATWRSKRVAADGWVDFRWSAHEVDKLVRAVSEPYPGAYSYIHGERVVFTESQLASAKDARRKGLPGQVLARSTRKLLVQCGDVPVWLSTHELRGPSVVRARIGDRFGFRVEDELHDLRRRMDELERRVGGQV